MSISVADNFQYLGAKPLDARVKYDTVANMVAVASANLYDGCLAYVTATKKNYQYDSSNDTDPTLGKWRELPTGGGGGSYTAGDGIDITNDVISTKQSEEGDIDEIIDVYPTAGNLVSIVNAFNKGDIYSTQERMIGQWVDGKPLYQRTFIDSSTSYSDSNSKRTFTCLSLTGVDYVNLVDANCSFGNATYFRNVTFSSNLQMEQNMYAMYNTTSHEGTVYVQTSNKTVTSIGYIITIQYTKTTDTAISIGEETEYSTDEKVIGTWVDGKPVFQRVLTSTAQISLEANTWVSTEFSIANVDVIINAGIIDTGGNRGQIWCGHNGNTLLLLSNRTNNWVAGAHLIIQYTKSTS